MKKVLAGVLIMAALNDSIISAIILCIMVFALLVWIMKEASKNNIQ